MIEKNKWHYNNYLSNKQENLKTNLHQPFHAIN